MLLFGINNMREDFEKLIKKYEKNLEELKTISEFCNVALPYLEVLGFPAPVTIYINENLPQLIYWSPLGM